MRRALIASASFLVILVFLFASDSYGRDEKRSFSALKYNYVVESDLTLSEFSQVFYERLKTRHHWDEVTRDNCQGETCYSTWKFTDDESNQWKCEVMIKKADDLAGSNKMLVSMEMNPVLGS
jgi:hypothetical protein